MADKLTAKERAAMKRLELENQNLRESIKKHLDVYRDQSIELIELRAKVDLLLWALGDEDGR
jgi:hypothetical protein